MSFTIPASSFHVVLEDGREFDVATDQRDQRRAILSARVEASEEDAVGFIRAVAWAALLRTGALEGVGWAEFDATATWVVPVENGDAVDPTGTAGAD